MANNAKEINRPEIVALLTLYEMIAGLDSAGMLQRHQSVAQHFEVTL